MKVIVYLNFIISALFFLCYFYQAVYVLVGLFKKNKPMTAKVKHRFAVMISARNEAAVIGKLLDSLLHQNYPGRLIDIFVVADNCTDNTAEVARSMGAFVYEREDLVHVGKGYALDWLLHRIGEDFGDKPYEGFFVFDADNVVDPSFVAEMNKVFDNGYRVITSYRNSKNFGKNWISAGYALWFLREARFLNHARMALRTSCAISGTGFLVSSEVFKENKGWIHHLLTEDIEFTTDRIIHGETIGYCGSAVLYDEQPEKFHQSYIQRLRWSKGFYQVFARYGKGLFKGILKGRFSNYDMLMTLMPAMLLTLISTALNLIALPVGILAGAETETMELLRALGSTILSFYGMFCALGAITTICEWHQIHCKPWKKVLFTFTFPLFMLTYVPISVIALFKKVEWAPITHSVSVDVSEIVQ